MNRMRPLRWLLVPIVVVPLVLLLTAGFGRDPRAIPSRLIGKPVPAFSLVTMDGRTLTQADLRGRPILLNFWASWCAPCVAEHAVLLDAAQRYGGRIAIVGVLYQDSVDGARGFEQRYGVPDWPTLLDPSGDLAIDFGVTGPPESYFIDSAGVVRDKQFGPVTAEAIDAKLAPLLVAGADSSQGGGG
jgi:cytochrome c biogenesis protein CcmG/thiol:disulfide interchange protein DsbE